MLRSPHLVPYNKVDDAIKKANRDTASETVRTLLVYGYNLDPPTGEQHEGTRYLFFANEFIILLFTISISFTCRS